MFPSIERKGDPSPASLCFPDNEKSCFACCPPIRPAGYEHIQFKQIIMRILRENREHFNRKDGDVIPITGFSCWALGYVDKGYRLVGCLLHPAQNRGDDLRYRIDFGEKCRRETCQEERIFSGLEETEKKFWLQLSGGLDSFAYSSKTYNPLFNMLGWGIQILRRIAREEEGKRFTRELFFRSYPFFKTNLLPKGNAYIINQLAIKEGAGLFSREDMKDKIETFLSRMKTRVLREFAPAGEGVHTHLLDVDPSFLDFLRLSLGIQRTRREDALAIKKAVDQEIERF